MEAIQQNVGGKIESEKVEVSWKCDFRIAWEYQISNLEKTPLLCFIFCTNTIVDCAFYDGQRVGEAE